MEKLEPLFIVVGKVNDVVSVGKSLAVPQKVKYINLKNFNLSYDLAIWIVGVYPQRIKSKNSIDSYTNVYNSIIHNSPKVETTLMSTNRQTDKKMHYIYTHNCT